MQKSSFFRGWVLFFSKKTTMFWYILENEEGGAAGGHQAPSPRAHHRSLLATDLLPSWLWKVSEWVSEVSEVSEVMKWRYFGPLFFLKVIYIIDHVYT